MRPQEYVEFDVTSPAASSVPVVSGGTAHGIGLQAPTGEHPSRWTYACGFTATTFDRVEVS